MKFTSLITTFGVLAIAQVLAQEAEEITHIEEVTFTPSNVPGHFVEQFDETWESRWTPSQATKEEQAGEVFSYRGKWAVEEPSVLPGFKDDLGLVLKTKAAHHAISAPFSKVLDPEGNTLVVQYETKLQNGLDCGGAYLKLLTDSPEGIESTHFSDKTPYTIMFGPDKCGATSKVHFIFRHKNPVTGEIEEKHLKNPPLPPTNSKLSTLYRLVVRPDQSFEIKINNESVTNGTLLDSFDPPVNPSAEIDDPEDFKPADWIDEPKIPDPDAVKPDDWDEDAPYQIDDPDAVKPEGWLDDEPQTIPDPNVPKPEEWSDEDDGDWIAPSIANPKCTEEGIPGCGEWKPSQITNPDYKGKWYAPYIDNPLYKGVWKARQIANPAFFEDLNPAAFAPLSGIGYELWTMSDGILFDNIYIGTDEDLADKFTEETWVIKRSLEEDKEKSDAPSDYKSTGPSVKEDPIAWARHNALNFVGAAVSGTPIPDAFKAHPEGGAIIGAAAAVVLGLLFAILKSLFGGKKAAAPPAAKPSTAATLKKDETEKVPVAVETTATTSALPEKDVTVVKRKVIVEEK